MALQVDTLVATQENPTGAPQPDQSELNETTLGWVLTGLREIPSGALPYFWPREALDRILLLATLLWGALLRLKFLSEPIRFDEASNALYYADRTFVYALAGGAGNDNHTLNSVLMWLSVRLFGWSEATVRAPAFAFGVLLIWSTFAFLRWSLRDRTVALTGAALVAVSPWMIYFSVNARGYIHQAFVVSLLTPVIIAGMQGRKNRSLPLGVWAGGLSFLGALCVRSMILFVGVLLIGCGLFALFGRRTARRDGSGGEEWKRQIRLFVAVWLCSMAVLAAAFFGPVAAVRGVLFLRGGLAGYGKQPLPAALEGTAQTFRALIPLFLASRHPWVVWVGYGTLLFGLAGLWSRSRFLVLFVAAFVAGGFLATPLLGFGLKPRFLPAGMVFLIPALGVGLVSFLPQRYRWLAFPAVLLGFPLGLTGPDVFHRIRDTGHIPQARDEARLLLAYGGLSNSLVVAPPLDDNGIAFYFIQTGRTQRNFASGYLRVRQESDTCGLRQAIASLPGSQGGDADVARAFERFSASAWYSRLDLKQSSIFSRDGTGGVLIRTPLKECSQ